jgi:uncharacterized protein YegJ (DUF2314 family)
MAVPKDQDSLKDMDAIAKGLEENCPKYGLEFVELTRNETLDCRMAIVKYLGREFKANFFKEPVSKENLQIFHAYHKLNYTELELLEREYVDGVTVAMDFSQTNFHPVVGLHLQIKVMSCLVQDIGVCVDFNTERLLSGVWCELQARTNTPPSLKYLYTVQAVGSDTNDNKVWLHTHGLNRCGFIEYEIMDTDIESCNDHAMLLSNFCDWVISNPKPIEEYQPIVIGRDSDGNDVVLTWMNWATANKKYDKMLIGGANYRDVAHSRWIGTIYKLENAQSTELLPISSLDIDKYRTSMMILPEQENVRISTLAKERLNFLRNWSALSSAKAKVKIALEIPKELQEKVGCKFEHIWATLHKLDKTELYCEILDYPRCLKDIHQGDKVKISLNNLSDWYLEVDNMQITPDTVYQLVE